MKLNVNVEHPQRRRGQSWNVAFDGANIWIAGALTETELRADGQVLGNFPFKNTAGIAFDGANIWVASTFKNSLNKL